MNQSICDWRVVPLPSVWQQRVQCQREQTTADYRVHRKTLKKNRTNASTGKSTEWEGRIYGINLLNNNYFMHYSYHIIWYDFNFFNYIFTSYHIYGMQCIVIIAWIGNLVPRKLSSKSALDDMAHTIYFIYNFMNYNMKLLLLWWNQITPHCQFCMLDKVRCTSTQGI